MSARNNSILIFNPSTHARTMYMGEWTIVMKVWMKTFQEEAIEVVSPKKFWRKVVDRSNIDMENKKENSKMEIIDFAPGPSHLHS